MRELTVREVGKPEFQVSIEPPPPLGLPSALCGGFPMPKVEAPEVERPDMVNHPRHYTSHPSGVECIDIVEHFQFSIGAAMKYLWRAGLKGDAIEDLKKARWYIEREIQRREAEHLKR